MVFKVGPLPITNSMIMVWIVALVIILVAQSASRDMKMVPAGWQNFVEWLVETLLNFFSGIMGAPLAKRTFWFIATVFILTNLVVDLLYGVIDPRVRKAKG